jgi:hypothetical protein
MKKELYTKIKLKSWAVQLTENNRIDVRNYFDDKHENHLFGFNSIDGYYGVRSYYGVRNDILDCSDKKSDFEQILSFEEFTSLINSKPLQTNVIENNYEIY